MRAKSFQDYIHLREADEGKSESSDDSGGLGTKVSLGDNNDYPPFEVSDDPKSEHYGINKNLAPIIRAFKGGGNWGWSKDDKSGDDKPVKIGTKKLFLAGGAVRSHLKGEKANNIELATSASPDEVYHLLKQNGFEFVDDMGTVDNKKSPHPNRKEGCKQIFWVMRANKGGRPFTFGIKVDEDEFELDVFQKSARGFDNMDKDPEPGSHEQDASSRDFTANSMYIGLGNDNGPNKELHDFHGGIHHMKAGKLEPIGGIKSMGKHPSRLLRMARFMGSGDGDMKHMSSEDLGAIRNMAGKVGKLQSKNGGKEYMMKEFSKGMKKEGTNGRKYLKVFKDMGLLDSIFPGKLLDQEDMPTEIDKTGDNNMALAWMLRMNAPEMLEDLGLDEKDMKKVMFLIKSLGMKENMDGNSLDDLTNGFASSGISGRKLKDWAGIGGLSPCMMDAFLAHTKSPRVSLYKTGEDGGESIDELFADLIDPFTGTKDFDGIKERKNHVELDNFRKHMEYSRPA